MQSRIAVRRLKRGMTSARAKASESYAAHWSPQYVFDHNVAALSSCTFQHIAYGACIVNGWSFHGIKLLSVLHCIGCVVCICCVVSNDFVCLCCWSIRLVCGIDLSFQVCSWMKLCVFVVLEPSIVAVLQIALVVDASPIVVVYHQLLLLLSSRSSPSTYPVASPLLCSCLL